MQLPRPALTALTCRCAFCRSQAEDESKLPADYTRGGFKRKRVNTTFRALYGDSNTRCGRDWCCIGRDTFPRKQCIWIVTRPWFDSVILGLIMLNSLTMLVRRRRCAPHLISLAHLAPRFFSRAADLRPAGANKGDPVVQLLIRRGLGEREWQEFRPRATPARLLRLQPDQPVLHRRVDRFRLFDDLRVRDAPKDDRVRLMRLPGQRLELDRYDSCHQRHDHPGLLRLSGCRHPALSAYAEAATLHTTDTRHEGIGAVHISRGAADCTRRRRRRAAPHHSLFLSLRTALTHTHALLPSCPHTHTQCHVVIFLVFFLSLFALFGMAFFGLKLRHSCHSFEDGEWVSTGEICDPNCEWEEASGNTYARTADRHNRTHVAACTLHPHTHLPSTTYLPS